VAVTFLVHYPSSAVVAGQGLPHFVTATRSPFGPAKKGNYVSVIPKLTEQKGKNDEMRRQNIPKEKQGRDMHLV